MSICYSWVNVFNILDVVVLPFALTRILYLLTFFAVWESLLECMNVRVLYACVSGQVILGGWLSLGVSTGLGNGTPVRRGEQSFPND